MYVKLEELQRFTGHFIIFLKEKENNFYPYFFIFVQLYLSLFFTLNDVVIITS